jgi:hypothetical protein
MISEELGPMDQENPAVLFNQGKDIVLESPKHILGGLTEKGKSEEKEDSSAFPIPKETRLACPYYKRFPKQFESRSICAASGWETVHRVK